MRIYQLSLTKKGWCTQFAAQRKGVWVLEQPGTVLRTTPCDANHDVDCDREGKMFGSSARKVENCFNSPLPLLDLFKRGWSEPHGGAAVGAQTLSSLVTSRAPLL